MKTLNLVIMLVCDCIYIMRHWPLNFDTNCFSHLLQHIFHICIGTFVQSLSFQIQTVHSLYFVYGHDNIHPQEWHTPWPCNQFINSSGLFLAQCQMSQLFNWYLQPTFTIVNYWIKNNFFENPISLSSLFSSIFLRTNLPLFGFCNSGL